MVKQKLNKAYNHCYINSLRLSVAYIHQQTRLSLVQIMARHRPGDKPLSIPTLVYCQLDLWEYNSVKHKWKFNPFYLRKYLSLQMSSAKWQAFCRDLNVLTVDYNWNHTPPSIVKEQPSADAIFAMMFYITIWFHKVCILMLYRFARREHSSYR